MATIDLLELLSVSADVSKKAAKILHDVVDDAQKNGGMKYEEKEGPLDVVTIADPLAQSLIIGTLYKYWPELQVVGEEDVGHDTEVPDSAKDTFAEFSDAKFVVPLKSVTVYVDPLDGTYEYKEGRYEMVTTLIGIAVDGVAHAGVIYQPWGGVDKTGALYWGLVGHGVEGFTPTPSKGFENMRVVTSRSHNNEVIDNALVSLKLPDDRVVRTGGAGNKSLLVAKGEADCYLYPREGTSKWDTCAPEGILNAQGGILTNKFGDSIDYTFGTAVKNTLGVIACSDKQVHKRVIESLAYSKL